MRLYTLTIVDINLGDGRICLPNYFTKCLMYIYYYIENIKTTENG